MATKVEGDKMKVKELVIELNKLNPEARVVVMLDHAGNQFMTPLDIYEEKEENEGTEEMSKEDIEDENIWMKGDIVIDCFTSKQMKKW